MSIEAMGGEGPGATWVARLFNWFRLANKQKLIAIVLIFDFASLMAGGLGTGMTSLFTTNQSAVGSVAIVFALTILTVYLLKRMWGYTIPALGNLARQLRLVFGALFASFFVVTGTLFLIGSDLAAYRSWFIAWLIYAMIVLPLFRLLAATAITQAEARGELARRAVIVGGGKATEDLLHKLEKANESAIRILGVFDDRGDERSPETIGRYRKIGTFAELENYCRDQRVDLLIIALPASAEERILHLMRKLWELPVDVRIAAHTSRLKLSKRAYTYIGGVPFLAVFDRPLSDVGSAMKSVFDRVVAAFALVALSPVMLITALAIKLDSKGPILFRQPRHGFNNEMIGVYKFRSMYTNLTDQHGAKQVTKGDPRVTRVGRFIRKSSIDELPQLFNVLRGELSLVGPRPHAVQSKAGNRLYQEVVDGYYARHRMKPGITGWAQINGWRGETDTAEKLERRVEHDLYYIENWSLLFDIYILAITPISLLNTKNAY